MNRLKSERAQGLIEFAVIFPFLVLFLFAIFDIGLALDRRATLQHAVREGARQGALNADATVSGLQPTRDRTWVQAQKLVPDAPIPRGCGGCQGIDICYEDINGDNIIGPGDAIDVVTFYTYKPFLLDSALGLFGTGFADMRIHPTGSARLEVAIPDQAAALAIPC